MDIDFGCILNDTDTARCVSMTNNSPLEVRYSWSFLKRPPVQRTEPAEQMDEGVDMESECESESLSEEEEEEEEEGEEEGEEGEEEGEEDSVSFEESPHEVEADGVPGEQTSNGDDTQPQTGNPPLEPIAEEQSQLRVDSVAGSSEPEVLESGLPPEGSTIEVGQVTFAENVSGSGDDRARGEVEESTSMEGFPERERKRRSPQPWELASDPFTPLSIEQVL